MQDEKKRRREPDANDAIEKAMKWADEFDQLGEDASSLASREAGAGRDQ